MIYTVTESSNFDWSENFHWKCQAVCGFSKRVQFRCKWQDSVLKITFQDTMAALWTATWLHNIWNSIKSPSTFETSTVCLPDWMTLSFVKCSFIPKASTVLIEDETEKNQNFNQRSIQIFHASILLQSLSSRLIECNLHLRRFTVIQYCLISELELKQRQKSNIVTRYSQHNKHHWSKCAAAYML